jgi:hypothetical protein
MTRGTRWLGHAVALASVIGLSAGCSSAAKTSGVPQAGASADKVARVYLRAAASGNCALTAALTLSHTWSWCGDPKLLSYRSVGNAGLVPASVAGRNEECVGFEMYTHGSSDGTMPTGWQPWSLCLVRTHDGWRLYDQGQG